MSATAAPSETIASSTTKNLHLNNTPIIPTTNKNLLPVLPVLFQPEFLLTNINGTLLIVAGSSGVLVMELPTRYPPYGTFDKNKDLVYCRTYTLEERLLICSDYIEVRQVKFHPGSPTNSHILLLTSDNILRFFKIENFQVISLGNYEIGKKPMGLFPSTKTTTLSALGEVGVDFDFGQPEFIDDNNNNNDGNIGKSKLVDDTLLLEWPVYILMGNGSIYYIHIPIKNERFSRQVKGPLPTNFAGDIDEDACSLLILNLNIEIFCIANSNGRIYHSIILPLSNDDRDCMKSNTNNLNLLPTKELLCFESVELELGLSTTFIDDNNSDNKYCCPIYLHLDESKSDRYFAHHSTGVHSVIIRCLEDLYKFINYQNNNCQLNDTFNKYSLIEYLICTKISDDNSSVATITNTNNEIELLNPVIGFALYYEPTSLITILSNCDIVSLGLLTTSTILNNNNLDLISDNKNVSDCDYNDGDINTINSTLKTILSEPFDEFILKILSRSNNQPIIKLSQLQQQTLQQSQKNCYELLQMASALLRDNYFDKNLRANDEIIKRIKTLQMMKDLQLNDIKQLNDEKIQLKNKAEELADKYENIKEKQDSLMIRCEKLLVLVSKNHSELSNNEKEFIKTLKTFQEKMHIYKKSIDKLKIKVEYQKLKMDNWKSQEEKKIICFNEVHDRTIRSNLKDMGDKIATMIKEVTEHKKHLNLK